jgi:hypothetical protein
MKLLFVLLSISLVSAQQFFNSPCPDRPVQQDFDLQKVSDMCITADEGIKVLV